MRACFFGTYNRDHSANRIYAAAVRAAGYELGEIHEALWEKTRDKDTAYFSPAGIALGVLRWLAAAVRLARRWFASGGSPVALVGFNGQLDVILLRLLAPRFGPRIVFAPLVSITETLIEDRGVYRYGTPAAALLRVIDRLACALADVVIVDTYEHRAFFSEVLGIDPSRVAVCHLGVDNDAFCEQSLRAWRGPETRADKLEVLYFGQYQPLHGLEVVVDAVGRLSRRTDLRFVFIGTGEHRGRIEGLLRATRADVRFVNWVPYERLAARIAEADIVLGVFGNSRKARMVIANKVYEAAAVGRPVVNADYPAVREVFHGGQDICLCAPDGPSLAEAITRLADDPAMRKRMGKAALELMRERFSDEAQGRAWSGPLAGPARLERTAGEVPLVGVAILNFNDAEATARCVASLLAGSYPRLNVLVVDNGSRPADQRALAAALGENAAVRIEWLAENRGYAGGNNGALRALFDAGCDYVLVLNNDTIVTPDAVAAMVRAARLSANAGPIGPRITRDWPGAKPASLGERYWAALAWLPRSLLRKRWPRQRAYPVRGVLGCAMLISRSLYARLGGFDERYFAYYEEVDYCLRACRAGLRPLVEPAAEIAHRGHRGFGSGLNFVAAYLKARNLWHLGRRRVGDAGHLLFVPGYFLMLGASVLGYLARGRMSVVRGLLAGMTAGLRGEQGRPPAWVFAGGRREEQLHVPIEGGSTSQ